MLAQKQLAQARIALEQARAERDSYKADMADAAPYLEIAKAIRARNNRLISGADDLDSAYSQAVAEVTEESRARTALALVESMTPDRQLALMAKLFGDDTIKSYLEAKRQIWLAEISTTPTQKIEKDAREKKIFSPANLLNGNIVEVLFLAEQGLNQSTRNSVTGGKNFDIDYIRRGYASGDAGMALLRARSFSDDTNGLQLMSLVFPETITETKEFKTSRENLIDSFRISQTYSPAKTIRPNDVIDLRTRLGDGTMVQELQLGLSPVITEKNRPGLNDNYYKPAGIVAAIYINGGPNIFASK